MRSADCNDLASTGDTGLDTAWAVFDDQAILGVVAEFSSRQDECCIVKQKEENALVFRFRRISWHCASAATHDQGKAFHA